MDIVLAIGVIALIGYLLHRDDRSNDRSNDRGVGSYWSQSLDRDAARVRADMLAGADRLSRMPLRGDSSAARAWEPRA